MNRRSQGAVVHGVAKIVDTIEQTELNPDSLIHFQGLLDSQLFTLF